MRQFIVIAAAAITFLSFTTPYASAQGRGRMSVKDRVSMLKDSLSLKNDQVKKITVILDSADKQRQELFDQSNGDRSAMREKMMSLMQDTDTKIEKVLTKVQKTKYEEIKKQRRQRMGQRHGEN